MNNQHDIDIQMMTLALEQAQCAANMNEVPVGAVVYKDDKVIASAHNLRETKQDPTAHAEIVALKIAAEKIKSWRLIDCSIAVTLEPCPMCAGALVNSRIKRLVYGAADPKMGAVDTLHNLCSDQRMNHRVEIVSGVMQEQCVKILQDFFKVRRG